MPKEKKKRKPKHEALGDVIALDMEINKYGALSSGKRVKRRMQSRENGEFMDEKTSRRILELSREQLLEENALKDNYDDDNKVEDSSVEEEEEDVKSEESFDEEENLIRTDDGYVNFSGPGLSEDQEALVCSILGGKHHEERRTLADMILEKIQEKEELANTPQQDDPQSNLPPKVIEVYTDIGKILSNYTAGKLPKAFKIIPSLSNWEEILLLTRPDLWTPQAMYAATRIFASNLNPKMAQRFFNVFLLDAARADIDFNNKLNYHYYHAILKASYKPAAFFKGIILPLAQPDAYCTLREGLIIASALRKLSIPMHHSAVAIIKLSTGRYTPSASIFLKELLNKKYSLPPTVIRSVVLDHFAQFVNNEHQLPVLWHQCLLVFVQRYKDEIKTNDEYKKILKAVMKVHSHDKITREVRRELFGSAAWTEERKTNAMLN